MNPMTRIGDMGKARVFNFRPVLTETVRRMSVMKKTGRLPEVRPVLSRGASRAAYSARVRPVARLPQFGAWRDDGVVTPMGSWFSDAVKRTVKGAKKLTVSKIIAKLKPSAAIAAIVPGAAALRAGMQTAQNVAAAGEKAAAKVKALAAPVKAATVRVAAVKQAIMKAPNQAARLKLQNDLLTANQKLKDLENQMASAKSVTDVAEKTIRAIADSLPPPPPAVAKEMATQLPVAAGEPVEAGIMPKIGSPVLITGAVVLVGVLVLMGGKR